MSIQAIATNRLPYNLDPKAALRAIPEDHPFRSALINAATPALAEKWDRIIRNDSGTTIFDLSKLDGKLTNTLLSNDVKMKYDDYGNTIFVIYLKKPNSNDPMVLQVQLKGYQFTEEEITEEFFNQTIGKAIQLMDKTLTIANSLGDRIPDYYGGGFSYNSSNKELDLKGAVASFKEILQYRVNGALQGSSPFWGTPISRSSYDRIMEELEAFLLNIGVKA